MKSEKKNKNLFLRPAVETDEQHRLSRGERKKGVLFPVPPLTATMPKNYALFLSDLKKRIQQERLRVVLASNAALVHLYWYIGVGILKKQGEEGWGAKVIDRLSIDLGKAFPDMKGFSPRNLKYMRAFAAAWPKKAIVQEALAQITWYHNITLLDKLKDSRIRIWYARKTIEHGWSRNILAAQIDLRLHERQGKAVHNFLKTLPPADSDMAAQVFKDPYVFDFLGTADPRKEAELEEGLMDHLRKSCWNLGRVLHLWGDRFTWNLATATFTLIFCFFTSSCAAMLSLS